MQQSLTHSNSSKPYNDISSSDVNRRRKEFHLPSVQHSSLYPTSDVKGKDGFVKSTASEKRILNGINDLYQKLIHSEKSKLNSQTMKKKCVEANTKFINIVHRPPLKLKQLPSLKVKEVKHSSMQEDDSAECKKCMERTDRMITIEELQRVYINRKTLFLPIISCIWYLSNGELRFDPDLTLPKHHRFPLHRTKSSTEYVRKSEQLKKRPSSAPQKQNLKFLCIEGERLCACNSLYKKHQNLTDKLAKSYCRTNHVQPFSYKNIKTNDSSVKSNAISSPQIFPFYENTHPHLNEKFKSRRNKVSLAHYNSNSNPNFSKKFPSTPPSTPTGFADIVKSEILSVIPAQYKKTVYNHEENNADVEFKNEQHNVAKELLILLRRFIEMAASCDIKANLEAFVQEYETGHVNTQGTNINTAAYKAAQEMYRYAKAISSTSKNTDNLNELLFKLKENYTSIQSVFDAVEKCGRSILLEKLGYKPTLYTHLSNQLKTKVKSKNIQYLYKNENNVSRNKKENAVFKQKKSDKPIVKKRMKKKNSFNIQTNFSLPDNDEIINDAKKIGFINTEHHETFNDLIIPADQCLKPDSPCCSSTVDTAISSHNDTDSISEFEFVFEEPYLPLFEATLETSEETPLQIVKKVSIQNEEVSEVNSSTVTRKKSTARKISKQVHLKDEITKVTTTFQPPAVFVTENKFNRHVPLHSEQLDSSELPVGDIIQSAEVIKSEKVVEKEKQCFETAKVTIVPPMSVVNNRKHLLDIMNKRRNKFDADRIKKIAEKKKIQDQKEKHEKMIAKEKLQIKTQKRKKSNIKSILSSKHKEEETKENKEIKYEDVDPETLHGSSKVEAYFALFPEECNRKTQKILSLATNSVITERIDRRVHQLTNIDYISHFKLVDRESVTRYTRSFAMIDKKEEGVISIEDLNECIYGVRELDGLEEEYIHYMTEILQLQSVSKVTIRMFCVIAALLEKMRMSSSMTSQDIALELFGTKVERKITFFRDMFYSSGELSSNFIGAEQLRVELTAGGLSKEKKEDILGHIQVDDGGDISFMDYMAYIPLFITIHNKIVENALDDCRDY